MSRISHPPDFVDVAIVGGGPAGTQAALVLARAQKRTVEFDERRPPRNAASHGMHNVFGMDGLLPTEIRDIAWRQIERYGGVELRNTEVLEITPHADGRFELATPDGRLTVARRVIAAFGYRDVLPDIPGFSACWAGNVIPCPFCDGYENRGGHWGIVPTRPGHASVFPVLSANWADRITLIAPQDMELDEDHAARLDCKAYSVVRGMVTKIDHDSGRLLAVTLDSGQRIELSTLLWEPASQRVPLLDRMIANLGVDVDAAGAVVVDSNQQTNVSGLYAVGDLMGWSGAISAAHMGHVADAHVLRSWFL